MRRGQSLSHKFKNHTPNDLHLIKFNSKDFECSKRCSDYKKIFLSKLMT